MKSIDTHIESEYSMASPAFKRGKITDSHGRARETWKPNEAMRIIQRRIIGAYSPLVLPEISQAATGSLEGCSPARNVERHAGNRYFFQLDFKNAYAQVEPGKLAFILCTIGGAWHEALQTEKTLRRYCFVPEPVQPESARQSVGQGVLFGNDLHVPEVIAGGLALGAATSPLLFNAYCIPLDEALLEYTEKRGLTYTRYLDDLTFSSSAQNGAINKNDRRIIREIIEKHEFELNHKKTRVSDINDNPVIITGLQLNKYGNWQITESYLRAAYTRLYELSETHDIDDIEVLELAAGYRGLLMSTADKKRAKLPESELRLTVLVDRIIGDPKLSKALFSDTDDWYNLDTTETTHDWLHRQAF
jgi:hypothetical protein